MSVQLVTAAWNGDIDQVTAALQAGVDPNTRDPANGLTVLMIAAGRGDIAMVETLLKAGADPLAVDSQAGASVLHKAVQGGNLRVVQRLVEAGAFVDAVAPTTGHTPVMDALWFKYPDIVDYLLNHGATLHLMTHYGFSFEEHIKYELNVNRYGKEKLQRAAESVQHREDRDAELIRQQRLMAAVVAGDLAGVRRELANGAEVDARYPMVNSFNDGHTPLLVACREGHVEIARALLEAGADVNAVEPVFGAVPLHKAVYNGRVDITELLVSCPGINLDYQGATNGYTPLHDALWHGYDDCARVLVQAGARLDLRGHDGKTPYDIAVETFGSDHDIVRAVRGTGD